MITTNCAARTHILVHAGRPEGPAAQNGIEVLTLHQRVPLAPPHPVHPQP